MLTFELHYTATLSRRTSVSSILKRTKKRKGTVTKKSQNLRGKIWRRVQLNDTFSKLLLSTLLISLTSSAKHKITTEVLTLPFRLQAAIYENKVSATVIIYCECRAFKYKHAIVISSSQRNPRHKGERHWWENHVRKCFIFNFSKLSCALFSRRLDTCACGVAEVNQL